MKKEGRKAQKIEKREETIKRKFTFMTGDMNYCMV